MVLSICFASCCRFPNRRFGAIYHRYLLFVFGIDLSLLTVRAAKLRHHGLKATGADVRHLPFADGVFDVIVSNSTLDHFESSDEIISSLQELHRVLRTGGQLLLTLDNLANPLISLRNVLPFGLLNRLNIVPYY